MTTSIATPSVSHSYEKSGTYNVSVALTTELGCKDTLKQEVEVKPRPEVSVHEVGDLCVNRETVFGFEAEDEVDATWSFGDGTTSFENSPQHAYDSSTEHTTSPLR